MSYFGAGIILLGIFLLLARAFTAVDPATLVGAVRYTIGAALRSCRCLNPCDRIEPFLPRAGSTLAFLTLPNE